MNAASKAFLNTLVQALQNNRGLAHKRDIDAVVTALDIANAENKIPVGDDCAAIPDGDGFLLFAIEGFINEFVTKDPWFAGWCGVMVNVSDIYAMGGRPVAVVDAIWDRDDMAMRPVLEGLAAASRAYNVPIVGGHSNARSEHAQLAVSIIGRAHKLLTSFDAKPCDILVAAIDLRAAYREPYSHWNATTDVDPARLRGDLELLPKLAESGLCAAAKDISQAGILGTAMMLLECSGIGAVIDIESIPRPVEVDAERWLLSTFPSFGFLLAVSPKNLQAVLALFDTREISCAPIGRCDDSRELFLRYDGQQQKAWDFREQAVIGCGAGAARNVTTNAT
ncbi:MAG: hypothetical protein JWM78_2268 [Verrucomicrobiaceae bacterium]|nr:hypothetical protein [Verrucomicrobiaceae bacterium]